SDLKNHPCKDRDRPTFWEIHPRICGEQRYGLADRFSGLGPSPRARGAVFVTWPFTNDKQLFLQLPEKPTNQTSHAQRPTLATQHTTLPEALPPTPAGLHHTGSVRPPRIGQRSTCTQRFVQRTPPHTSRMQSLTTHRQATTFSQRLRHHVIQLGDLFAHRQGSLRHHFPHRRRRGTRTQQPVQTPTSSIHPTQSLHCLCRHPRTGQHLGDLLHQKDHTSTHRTPSSTKRHVAKVRTHLTPPVRAGHKRHRAHANTPAPGSEADISISTANPNRERSRHKSPCSCSHAR